MKDRILKVLLFAILGIGFFFVALCIPALVNVNSKEYVTTVTDKEIRIVRGKIEGQNFLVHTTLKDGENRIFSVQDSVFLWRFNAKDVHNQIEIGKTYKFVVVGLYEPAVGLYENILNMEEIE